MICIVSLFAITFFILFLNANSIDSISWARSICFCSSVSNPCFMCSWAYFPLFSVPVNRRIRARSSRQVNSFSTACGPFDFDVRRPRPRSFCSAGMDLSLGTILDFDQMFPPCGVVPAIASRRRACEPPLKCHLAKLQAQRSKPKYTTITWHWYPKPATWLVRFWRMSFTYEPFFRDSSSPEKSEMQKEAKSLGKAFVYQLIFTQTKSSIL